MLATLRQVHEVPMGQVEQEFVAGYCTHGIYETARVRCACCKDKEPYEKAV